MKKLTFLFLSIIAIVFVACGDDEKGSYPPTYQGFRYEPSVAYAGDSVFITAVQQRKGHLLNATDYTWSMNVVLVNSDEIGRAHV